MLRGRLNVNNAPPPPSPPPFSWLASLFEANILPPPWASIMLFEIKSQSPVPDWDFVANFDNSIGIISWCIPQCYSKRISVCVCVCVSFCLITSYVCLYPFYQYYFVYYPSHLECNNSL